MYFCLPPHRHEAVVMGGEWQCAALCRSRYLSLSLALLSLALTANPLVFLKVSYQVDFVSMLLFVCLNDSACLF